MPSGLLGVSQENMFGGFKKTYQNCYLRVGIVVQSYNISDDSNISKTTTEYDVLVFEQNEDGGSTVLTYKNCIDSAGFGSIADFFEAKLRKMENKTTPGTSPDPTGQNGAIVLLLCLNGLSDRGVIISSLTHPDRATTLVDNSPHLEGEYNGVHIVVNSDGSTSLTFRGATDNDGNIVDSSQGDTVLSIEKDGSYQIQHSTITQRLDKNGKVDLTTKDDISNTTDTNFNVTATKDIVLDATGDFNASMNKLTLSAQGSAMLQSQKLALNAESEIDLQGSQISIEAEAMANIQAPIITLDGIVSLGGDGGTPILLMTTIMYGIGNVGLPVISQAISGYAIKVTGQ